MPHRLFRGGFDRARVAGEIHVDRFAGLPDPPDLGLQRGDGDGADFGINVDLRDAGGNRLPDRLIPDTAAAVQG
jgi:hypothetical protein